MTAWIGPLVSAGVAIVQALEGARATAGEAERAEIDRALATIRGTDTRATARHDDDLAARLARGGAPGPHASSGQLDAAAALGVRQTEPPPSPYDGPETIDPSALPAALRGEVLAEADLLRAVDVRDLPPDLRARVLAYVRTAPVTP